MAYPSVTYTISNGNPNDGAQVAQNFTDLVNGLSDGTKDLNVAALTANGSITLGDNVADDLTVTASLASTFPIKTNATYAFGSTTKGLTALYFGNSTFTIGLTCPTLAASYTLTLPTAVPASTLPVVMSTAGALSTSAITQAMRAALGEQISSSSGNFSTTTVSSSVSVTNLSVTITTTGRRVFIGLVPDGTSNTSYVGNSSNAGSSALEIKRDGTAVARMQVPYSSLVSGAGGIPVGGYFVIEAPAAGSYTYTVTLDTSSSGGSTFACKYAKLLAYEL